MFRFLGKVLMGVGKFLFLSQVFRKKEGAKLLQGQDIERFLSSRNTGLLLDGYKRRLSEKESFQNVCLTARVGAGKSTKYIIPNVLDKASRNCSLAVHDPKGEVRDLTSGYLHARGFHVVVFDVQDTKHSHCFNPCLEAVNEIELEQIAQTLIYAGNPNDADPYWNNGAVRILSVLLKCLSFGEE